MRLFYRCSSLPLLLIFSLVAVSCDRETKQLPEPPRAIDTIPASRDTVVTPQGYAGAILLYTAGELKSVLESYDAPGHIYTMTSKGSLSPVSLQSAESANPILSLGCGLQGEERSGKVYVWATRAPQTQPDDHMAQLSILDRKTLHVVSQTRFELDSWEFSTGGYNTLAVVDEEHIYLRSAYTGELYSLDLGAGTLQRVVACRGHRFSGDIYSYGGKLYLRERRAQASLLCLEGQGKSVRTISLPSELGELKTVYRVSEDMLVVMGRTGNLCFFSMSQERVVGSVFTLGNYQARLLVGRDALHWDAQRRRLFFEASVSSGTTIAVAEWSDASLATRPEVHDYYHDKRELGVADVSRLLLDRMAGHLYLSLTRQEAVGQYKTTLVAIDAQATGLPAKTFGEQSIERQSFPLMLLASQSR